MSKTSIQLDIPETAEGRAALIEERARVAAKPQVDRFRLLLTVARILRAKIRDEIYAEQRDDLEALNEALAPFDPVPSEPVNECSGKFLADLVASGIRKGMGY